MINSVGLNKVSFGYHKTYDTSVGILAKGVMLMDQGYEKVYALSSGDPNSDTSTLIANGPEQKTSDKWVEFCADKGKNHRSTEVCSDRALVNDFLRIHCPE